jgi:hypothetical protein
MRSRALIAIFGLSLLSSVSEARPARVVLVTIDGVRANEVFDGVDPALASRFGLSPEEILSARKLTPHLHRLMSAGVALGGGPGAPIEASGPNWVSLPGYREILTGRAGGSCDDNVCRALREPTLLDELRAHDLPSGDVAVISSWETIENAASRDPGNITISAGRHGGASRDRVRVSKWANVLLDGAASSDSWPGHFDYRADRYTTEIALEYLARVQPRFLMVGLGDTDEYAHRKDYGGYVGALAAADHFLGRLVGLLDALGLSRDTLILVTTDHGRSSRLADHGRWHPESKQVWALASGPLIPSRGTLTSCAPHRLRDLAPTLRLHLALPPDSSPLAGVPIREMSPEPERVATNW